MVVLILGYALKYLSHWWDEMDDELTWNSTHRPSQVINVTDIWHIICEYIFCSYNENKNMICLIFNNPIPSFFVKVLVKNGCRLVIAQGHGDKVHDLHVMKLMVKKEYIFSCYEAAVNMNQVLHKLNLATHHSIYIRTVSLLSALLNRFKLVHGTSGHLGRATCLPPWPARKEMNVPKLNSS